MQCKKPITLKGGDVVPCGKCVSCLANQRQEWVFRLQEEFSHCNFGLFVTLTYNEESIPADLSVNKRDCQLFFKRLRKRLGKSGTFRYYFISEYGDHGHRPHYHGLFFFHDGFDRRFVYDSIEEAWHNGFVKFGEIETGSIVYCTKYCLKKNTVPPGRKSNFRLVSKQNGGIGYQYLDRMGEFHKDDFINNMSYVVRDGVRCRMPGGFRDKIYKDIYGKHRSLNPAYMQFRELKRSLTLDRKYNEFNKGFAEFLKTRHFEDLTAAQLAYNEHVRGRGQRQEELILKHTKKQVL